MASGEAAFELSIVQAAHMLIDFFFTLKKGGVPCTIREFLNLLDGLNQHVIYGSVDDFYHLSRVCLVKNEAHFDRFDRAFAEYF